MHPRGFGLKLRLEHLEELLTEQPAVDWLEILTEDYLGVGGYARQQLQQLSHRYPLALHGVSMSLGGTDPLDINYLRQLKALADELGSQHISDHLCWSSHAGISLHELLPLPYTNSTVQHLVTRINQVQDYLGQNLIVENLSSYLTYVDSEMTEWEFVSAVQRQSGCLLLLDINNIYVSSVNHAFDPLDYLSGIPLKSVAQIHLAGHQRDGKYLIDTHDSPVCQEVWELYALAVKRLPQHVPVLLERDAKVPPLAELLAELELARSLSPGWALSHV